MASISKIEYFRQIKNSITKNKKYLLIGIDASKSSSVACFYNIEQEILLRKYIVEHNIANFQQFCAKIEQIMKMNDFQLAVIGVEPTANYHKPLCEYLKNKGYLATYVSSVAAKNNRKTIDSGRWGKNDPRDAYNIIDLMRQGKILYYRDENTESKDIHKYLMLRQRLVKLKSILKNRIQNNIWACHSPELCSIFSNSGDPDSLVLLENCPSSQQVRNMDFQSFMKLFPEGSKTRSKRSARLRQIWLKAKTSIGLPIPSSTTFEAKLISRDIQRTQKDIACIDKILSDFCLQPGVYRNLMSMPGFGVFTTSVFKSILGDINDFRHSRQIVKFAGLDIEPMASGNFKGKEKISKKGNSLLRFAVCQAVNIAVAKNKVIRQLFQDKLKERGSSKEAKAKLKIKFAEKFLKTAFVLLKNNVQFDINLFTVPVDDPVQGTVRA